LIHGCGFASALADAGIPEKHFLSSLLAFNLGIEIAQILFILICFILFRQIKNPLNYRKYVIVPLSFIIIFAGLFWTFERLSVIGIF
jgi:hypothetical protein